jgi:cytoskeletal protein RodZ
MILLILEALMALLILFGIVWWTMFSGRSKGEFTGEIKSEVSSESDTTIKTTTAIQEEKQPPQS